MPMTPEELEKHLTDALKEISSLKATLKDTREAQGANDGNSGNGHNLDGLLKKRDQLLGEKKDLQQKNEDLLLEISKLKELNKQAQDKVSAYVAKENKTKQLSTFSQNAKNAGVNINSKFLEWAANQPGAFNEKGEFTGGNDFFKKLATDYPEILVSGDGQAAQIPVVDWQKPGGTQVSFIEALNKMPIDDFNKNYSQILASIETAGQGQVNTQPMSVPVMPPFGGK